MGCVFQDGEPPKSKSILRTVLKDVHYATPKFAKERVHRRELSSILILTSVGPLLQNLKTDLMKKPWNKGDAPAEMHDRWRKVSTSSKKRTNLETEFVVDSGASMHMSRRKSLTSAELETTRVSRNPATVITANGVVHMRKQQRTSTIWICSWQYKSSRIRPQSYRWEKTLRRSRETHIFLKTCAELSPSVDLGCRVSVRCMVSWTCLCGLLFFSLELSLSRMVSQSHSRSWSVTSAHVQGRLKGKIKHLMSELNSQLQQLCFYTYHLTCTKSPKNGRKYNATLRITCPSLFWDCPLDLPARQRVHPQHGYRRTHLMILRQVHQQYDLEAQAFRYWETSCEILQNPTRIWKEKDTVPVQGNRFRDLPEFTENPEEGVSASRDTTASTSHDSDPERHTKVVPRGSTVSSRTFSKDRNCKVRKRTKVTRAPCRRRTGEAVLHAEKIGDLVTADQKVLSEGSEPRNNHRYAVVIQALAIQWIQSYPCETQTSQETERSLRKFLEPSGKPKVIYTDIKLEFAKSLWGLIMNEWYFRESGTQNQGRNFCCAVAIRFGWKVVGWFPGFLVLSAKRSRHLVGRDNTSWTAIKRTHDSFRIDDRVSSDLCQKPVKTPPTW